MNLTQIREKYPDYNDLSDEQLARGFHRKFYTDMPWNDFKRKVGYIPGRVIEPKEIKVEEPSFIRDVVGQTAKDVAGIVAKVGSGYAKGMTLGAIDIERGTIGIPFTSIKKQVAPALAPSLEKVVGVSPEIAENPYIGIPTEFLGVIGPWSMASKLVGRGVGYLQAIRIGKNLMKITNVARRTETATNIIKNAAIRTGQQAITGGLVGAAHVREEDESLLRNIITYAAFGAGLQMLGEGINVIATSTGLSRYGAYKNLKKDLSDLLYKNRKEPLTKGEVEDIADLAINEQLQKAGIQKATRKDLNKLRKSTKVIRTKIEKARAERGEPKVEPTPEEATAQAQAQAQAQKEIFLKRIAQDIADPTNPLTPANVAFMGKSPEIKALGITQAELNVVAAKAMGDTTITSVTEDITVESQKALEKFYDELEEVEPVEIEKVEAEPTFKEEREFWEEVKEEPGIQEVKLKKEPPYRIGEGREPKEGVWYKTKKGELVRKEDLEEVKPEEEIKPTATFRGWQETAKGDHIALYNIEGGRLDKSTVAVATLKREGIEIPETPEKPIPKAKEPWEMEREEVKEAKLKIPIKHLDLIKEIQVVPNISSTRYLPRHRILQIPDKSFPVNYIYHEVGSAVWYEKIADTPIGQKLNKIYDEALKNNKGFYTLRGKDRVSEFFSDSYRAFIDEPNKLKAINPDMYKLLNEEIGKIKSHPDYPELGKVKEKPIKKPVKEMDAINELYAKAIEQADRLKNIAEVKRLKKELQLIGGTITTPSEMRKMRQIIHAWKYYKGLTDTQYRNLVKKTTGHLSTTHKDIDAEQLKKILRKIQKIRPRQVGYKKVITENTESRIETLKDTLLAKGEITEEIYADILNYMRIKEPVYISRHRFITETQGKEVIDKMLKSVPIAKLTIDKQLTSQPAIRKEIDNLESHFKKEQMGKIKVSSLLDMHHFADSMQKQSGAKFGELYEKIRNVKKNTDKKIDDIIKAIRQAGGTTFTDITKSPESIQRINDYVASKLSDYVKGKPKFPKNITSDEINIAKTIIAGLKGKEAEVRYHRFYEWRENNVPIPNAPEKELNTATEILETQGDEALKKWLAGRSWGIKRTGYDAGEVINPTVKRAEIKPGFGKRGLRTSESIEYLKSEKDILKRYASYMRQMTYRTELKPLIDAWTELFESNKHKFENPHKVADLLTRNVREVLGHKEQLQILEKFMVRAYSQAARTIFLDLRKGVRNLFQNLAFYTDLKDITKLKKLSFAEKEFFETHVSQMKGIQRDWLYQDYRGMPGLGKLNEIADLINVMGRSDTINRLAAFRMKLGAFEKILKKYSTNIETDSSKLSAMMKETKFGDLEPMQRLHALKILAKEGKKSMALYWTKAYVEKVHFLYERFERAPAEQGREISRILSNLLTFRKGYVQRIILDARKLRRSQKIIENLVEGRKQVVKSLIGLAIMGIIASWLYQKLTGDDREPYHPDKIIGDISVGGLATGMQEQIGDLTRDMLGAATGDKNALGRTINGITRAADGFLPFYDEAINAIEGLSGYVNVDKALLRQIRNELDKRYKAKPMEYYKREREAFDAAQHIIFGTESKPKEGKKASSYY